jgi:hypothetical protein
MFERTFSQALTMLLALALLAACAPGEDAPEAPPQEARICPAAPYLNCMPIVPPERQEFCAPGYREWINANCPGVEIVY